MVAACDFWMKERLKSSSLQQRKRPDPLLAQTVALTEQTRPSSHHACLSTHRLLIMNACRFSQLWTTTVFESDEWAGKIVAGKYRSNQKRLSCDCTSIIIGVLCNCSCT
ncbi:hypothetical protein AMECASPLE_012931 [Ameca splendens]|uniref:Uncharacterized protein n=1 Tax=Ameca splendens TaxID=208324 RepID=A0ABV0ZKZ3_9TELE